MNKIGFGWNLSTQLVQTKFLRWTILSWSLQCRSMWLAKCPHTNTNRSCEPWEDFVTQLMHREIWQKEWGVLQTLTHSHSTGTSRSKWNKFGNSQILIFIPLPKIAKPALCLEIFFFFISYELDLWEIHFVLDGMLGMLPCAFEIPRILWSVCQSKMPCGIRGSKFWTSVSPWTSVCRMSWCLDVTEDCLAQQMRGDSSMMLCR